MRFFKLLILLIIFSMPSLSFAEQLNNCSKIENLAKKILCKTKIKSRELSSKIDSATESITSKKTLADLFKKKND